MFAACQEFVMCLLKVTKDTQDLKGILNLQQENLPENISTEEKADQGFVTVHHTLAQLEEMVRYEPQMVAIDNNQVVGYVLSMVKEMKDEFPEIAPMFDLFPHISYQGKPLSSYSIIVCGQACIAKSYRGKGLVSRLYQTMRETFQSKYTLCVTEVASSNTRSLAAHRKIGFQTVKIYNDGKEDWEIVVWQF